MLTVRPGRERGHFNHGWLETYHTFSFADYRDRRHMHFRSLRVINEDTVQAAQGFGTHPHEDMEIITYVTRGALQHKDSMGTGSIIRPGDMQVMSAGTGITHSEFNASPKELVHLLQIWIYPDRRGITPRYDQKHFAADAKLDRLKLVGSRTGREGTILINQDADLYASILSAGKTVEHRLAPGRGAWIQVVAGAIDVNGQALGAGDGLSCEDEPRLTIAAGESSELLLFDLGPFSG